MEKPKLQITAQKYTESSSVISLRLPKDMLRDIDLIANLTGRARNEILISCTEFALNNIEILYNEKLTSVDLKDTLTGLKK